MRRSSAVGLRRILAFPALVLAACAGMALASSAACSKHAAPAGESADASAAESADATTTAAEFPASPDGGEPEHVFIALAQISPVLSTTEWPPKDPTKASEERQGVTRLGYLRRGSRVAIKPNVIKKGNCPEGWYELLSSGFVCGKYGTLDPNHKDLKNAPHPPYMDRPLPYEYGLNLTPGAPLYRRVPLKRERAETEKTLAIGKGAKSSDVVKRLRERGEEIPAYLRETGEAKPHVGLEELKGESGLVVERMLQGFYVSLDQKVDAFSGSFWRTTSGYFTPKDHLIVHKSKTEFEGVVLGAPDEKRKLPLAYVVSPRARRYEVVPAREGSAPSSSPREGRAKRFDKIERFTILGLTGKHQVLEERTYWETDEGFWVRDIDVAVMQQPKPPSDLAPGEKWIDVDLSSESLVAFEGDKPVYATVVSTGRHDDNDPSKDHRTVSGTFHIREKHITSTMDDSASDGTYRIEDVPWVMYFEKSYALHGAFWHSQFGREKSHGCVNLSPHDARHIFLWAGPKLPDGWHGVRATPENPGTRVVVHK